MVSRLSIQLSRGSAAGLGTGDGGSPSRRRTWSPLWTTSSTVMADDAAERLCVEQDDGGRDPSSEWEVVVGQEAAEQLYPLVLRERFRLAEPRRRQSKAPGDLAGDAPQQEGPDGVAAVFAVFDMPGVDVGLAAGGQGEAVLGEPLKEGRGGLDLVAGIAAAGRSDRLSLRAGAEPRQDFPSGEAADELGMVRVGDVSEMADQPPLERADLLVDGGEPKISGHVTCHVINPVTRSA